MAAITRDEPETGAPQSASTATSTEKRARRISLGNLSNTHLWILGMAAVVVALVVSLMVWGAAMAFPADVGRDIGDVIDAVTSWFAVEGDWLWDVVKIVILAVLLNLEDLLIWLPWPALILGVGLLAWRTAGVQVALFSIIGLLAMGFVGLWETTMETLALIVTSVVLSVFLGVPLGILGARNNLADSIMRPILDGMQTMPSFVYLVPAIFFFSIGNVSGGNGHHHLCSSSGCSPDQFRDPTGLPRDYRGRSFLRGQALANTVEGADPNGFADYYGGDQPDHHDGVGDGGGRSTGRRRWIGRSGAAVFG